MCGSRVVSVSGSALRIFGITQTKPDAAEICRVQPADGDRAKATRPSRRNSAARPGRDPYREEKARPAAIQVAIPVYQTVAEQDDRRFLVLSGARCGSRGALCRSGLSIGGPLGGLVVGTDI